MSLFKTIAIAATISAAAVSVPSSASTLSPACQKKAAALLRANDVMLASRGTLFYPTHRVVYRYLLNDFVANCV